MERMESQLLGRRVKGHPAYQGNQWVAKSPLPRKTEKE